MNREEKKVEETVSTSIVAGTKAQETKAKPPKVLTVDIVCQECGAIRTVGKGEVFQVKRCVPCQERFAKAQRKAYRKARLARLKIENKVLRQALVDLEGMTEAQIDQLIKNKEAGV